MNPAHTLLARCRAAGLTIRRTGDHLAVRPAARATPEILSELRAHKPQLLDLLEAETSRLTPDCAPWLHIARQVLCGEFDDGDHSLLESLHIGLRSIAHPVCESAKTRLEALLSHRKEARR